MDNGSTKSNEHVINMHEPLSVRLKQLADTYVDGNLSEFAKLTGVPRTTLDDCVKKRSLPKVDFIGKIKHALPDVDLNWLLNPSEKYRNTNLGDKIWLVSDGEVGYGATDDSLAKENTMLKENNATLKEFNDMLKGQVEFLKAELAKSQAK
jgi:hypothetical protein